MSGSRARPLPPHRHRPRRSLLPSVRPVPSLPRRRFYRRDGPTPNPNPNPNPNPGPSALTCGLRAQREPPISPFCRGGTTWRSCAPQTPPVPPKSVPPSQIPPRLPELPVPPPHLQHPPKTAGTPHPQIFPHPPISVRPPQIPPASPERQGRCVCTGHACLPSCGLGTGACAGVCARSPQGAGTGTSPRLFPSHTELTHVGVRGRARAEPPGAGETLLPSPGDERRGISRGFSALGTAAGPVLGEKSKKWRFWFSRSSGMEGERFLLPFGVKRSRQSLPAPAHIPPVPPEAPAGAGEPSPGLSHP